MTDLAWSPFDSSLLVVGTDQGLVNIWRIPEKKEGEEETPRRTELEPEQQLRLGGEKVRRIEFVDDRYLENKE